MAQNTAGAEEIERLLRRRLARKKFLSWCDLALEPRRQVPARHHRLLISKLQGVADGLTDKLMIQMPPGHAKSTYTSELFPPWFMANNPGAQFISGSAGLDLATDFSGKVLKLIEDFGPDLGFSASNTNKELWYTSTDCRYKATGVSGNIAGSRGDMILIDDPVGSRKDADSPAMRKAAYDWYRGDLVGRAKPGCKIILIMTRWHEDDLAGRLLQDDPGGWDVLKLPAIAEANDQMGRAPGELLWPEYETAAVLAKKRKDAGEREWNSQWQQRPAPLEGVLFDPDKLTVLPWQEPVGKRVRAWDLASSEKVGTRDPDYTVGLDIERLPNDRYLIRDVVRTRGAPQHVEDTIIKTAKKDGTKVPICLPVDPGQAGVSQVAYLARGLAGHTIVKRRPTGSKSQRAMPVASQVNLGNVAMLLGAWNYEFKEELGVFPAGSHDDQIDALSDGFAELVTSSARRGVAVEEIPY